MIFYIMFCVLSLFGIWYETQMIKLYKTKEYGELFSSIRIKEHKSSRLIFVGVFLLQIASIVCLYMKNL